MWKSLISTQQSNDFVWNIWQIKPFYHFAAPSANYANRWKNKATNNNENKHNNARKPKIEYYNKQKAEKKSSKINRLSVKIYELLKRFISVTICIHLLGQRIVRHTHTFTYLYSMCLWLFMLESIQQMVWCGVIRPCRIISCLRMYTYIHWCVHMYVYLQICLFVHTCQHVYLSIRYWGVQNGWKLWNKMVQSKKMSKAVKL